MDHSQSGWQIAGGIVLVPEQVVAFVDGVEEEKGVADAEQGGQAAGDQLPGRRPRGLVDMSGQLFHQLLLAPFNIRLKSKQHKDY